jgi:hypothetical protein
MRGKASDDGWYCFNSASVSELTAKNALRIGYGHSSARNVDLLFDQREDVFGADPTNSRVVADELPTEIADNNLLNHEYRLYCSSAYFKPMKCWCTVRRECASLLFRHICVYDACVARESSCDRLIK